MQTHTRSTSPWIEDTHWISNTLDQQHTGLRQIEVNLIIALWGHTLDQHLAGLRLWLIHANYVA